MKTILTTVALACLIAPLTSHAGELKKPKPCSSLKDTQAKCDCYYDWLDYYEDRMRDGYTAAEYNKLESERRKYRRKTMQCR